MSSNTSKRSILLTHLAQKTSKSFVLPLFWEQFIIVCCKCSERIGEKLKRYVICLIVFMRFLMLVILHNVLITRLSLWLPQWMLKAFSFSLISVQRDHSEHHLLPQHYPILALNSFLGQTQPQLDYRQPLWTSSCHSNETYNEQTSKSLHIFPLFCQHIWNKKTVFMYLVLHHIK